VPRGGMVTRALPSGLSRSRYRRARRCRTINSGTSLDPTIKVAQPNPGTVALGASGNPDPDALAAGGNRRDAPKPKKLMMVSKLMFTHSIRRF